MKTYSVIKGTNAKLITQEENEDVIIEDWVVRKQLSFTSTIANPEDWRFIPCPYPDGSMAKELLAEGYIVFSMSGKNDDKYMLAVLQSKVNISDE